MTIRSASDGSEADPTAADRTDARMSAKMANKSLKFILTSFVFLLLLLLLLLLSMSLSVLKQFGLLLVAVMLTLLMGLNEIL